MCATDLDATYPDNPAPVLSVSLSRIECVQPAKGGGSYGTRREYFQYPFRGSNVCNRHRRFQRAGRHRRLSVSLSRIECVQPTVVEQGTADWDGVVQVR